jgi:hypothetical protein
MLGFSPDEIAASPTFLMARRLSNFGYNPGHYVTKARPPYSMVRDEKGRVTPPMPNNFLPDFKRDRLAALAFTTDNNAEPRRADPD